MQKLNFSTGYSDLNDRSSSHLNLLQFSSPVVAFAASLQYCLYNCLTCGISTFKSVCLICNTSNSVIHFNNATSSILMISSWVMYFVSVCGVLVVGFCGDEVEEEEEVKGVVGDVGA